MRRYLLLLLALAACDRPLVDRAGPRVEVVRPASLDVVQAGAVLDLALRADVFGTIDSVTVNRQRMRFDGGLSAYQADVALSPGLNVLAVDVYADAERLGSDTLYAFRAALAPVTIPVSGSPAPVADAAVSALDAGDVLLSGGAGADGTARASATRISVVGGVLRYDRVALATARAQHSSTLLPDGRVLLVGGVASDAPGARQLAGGAEVVDLGANTSAPVPVVDREGAPVSIERAGHAARGLAVDGVFVLYLYGGLDDRNAPSNTFDVFRWDDGTLVRLSPPLGTGGGSFPAFPAPVIASVTPRGVAEASSVVFGRSADAEAPTALRFDWLAATSPTYPFDLEARGAAPLAAPRSGAAAVATDGFALVSGGTLANGTVTGTFEAYVPSVDRTFRFDGAAGLRTPRTDHSATLLPDGRILIVGGRDATGAPLFSPEAFQL